MSRSRLKAVSKAKMESISAGGHPLAQTRRRIGVPLRAADSGLTPLHAQPVQLKPSPTRASHGQ